MKKFKTYLFLFLPVAVVVIAGCSSRVAPTITTVVKDSVVFKQVVRHDTVSIPGETITVTKWLECDTVTNTVKPIEIREKKNHVTLSVKVKDGALIATCKSDSLLKVLELKDSIITHYHSESVKEKIPVVTHEPRWYDMMCRWIVGIELLLLIALLVRTYFKMQTKIL